MPLNPAAAATAATIQPDREGVPLVEGKCKKKCVSSNIFDSIVDLV
jgi:hypothetical protein